MGVGGEVAGCAGRDWEEDYGACEEWGEACGGGDCVWEGGKFLNLFLSVVGCFLNEGRVRFADEGLVWRLDHTARGNT